jgi:hypothetical protein
VPDDSSTSWRIALVATDIDFLLDMPSDTRPRSTRWVDDLAGSGTLSRTGGLSGLLEETITGSGWDNINGVVPPDSAPYVIEGVEGVGDESVGLTSRLSEASGSLWSRPRASWT